MGLKGGLFAWVACIGNTIAYSTHSTLGVAKQKQKHKKQQQRIQVYAERRRALLSTDLGAQMVEYAERTVDDILEANVDAALPYEEWPLDVCVSRVCICSVMGHG